MGLHVDDNGEYDEFDYAGADLVAPASTGPRGRGLRGMRGEVPRDYIGKPVGQIALKGSVSTMVEGLQSRFGGPAGAAASRAMKVWRQMGDRRARMHVRGLFLRQNRASRELIAYVDASVWMHEFSMLVPSYLQEWNHLCEENGLDMRADKITFRLSSKARAAGQSGSIALGGTEAVGAADPAGRAPRVALTAEERARVERTVAPITNPRLRQAAYDAMKTSLECQKAQKGRNGA